MTVLDLVRQRFAAKRLEPQERYAQLRRDMAAGKSPAADTIVATLEAAGLTEVDLENDLAAAVKRKRLQATRMAGINAASQISELSTLIEQTAIGEAARRKEIDTDQAERRSQLNSLQASTSDGRDAEVELFDSGDEKLKADYFAIKANERTVGRTLTDAESNLKIASVELDQAQIRVHNVEIGRGDGDLAELRAAVKPLEIKKADAQRAVDSAKAACDAARAQTAAARQAVIES